MDFFTEIIQILKEKEPTISDLLLSTAQTRFVCHRECFCNLCKRENGAFEITMAYTTIL